MIYTKKTLLLDLDGTLVDSYNIHYQTWNVALQEIGVTIDKSIFDEMSGSDSMTAARFFHKDGTEEDWSRLIERKEIEFRKRIPSIQLFDGARELIQIAKSFDCKIGLVTSASQDSLEEILSLVNMLDAFDLILSVETVKVPKPSPDLLLQAVSILQGVPDQAIYIGDAIIDIVMAQKAFVASIGVANDSEKLLALLNAGADRVARDLFEVIALFKSWLKSPDNYLNKSVFSNQIVFLHSKMNPIWEYGRPPMNDPIEGPHWVMQNSTRPVSIGRVEAYFLYNLVRLVKYQTAVEIGTGFGYSSWWIAAGMVKSEGCWVGSLDNYSEGEQKDNLLKFAQYGAKHLNLDNIINYFVGESPTDMKRYFDERKLDFAFIDGNHYNSQPLLDYEAICPYMTESSCLVFHDVNSRYTVERAISRASGNGWHIQRFSTSCQIVACVLDNNLTSIVERAFVLAKNLEFAD